MTYRDHASYLQEWLEFHMLVGIERFFLYDNGSTDDHEEVLAPYVAEGIVVMHHWPGAGQRYAALNHCVETYRDEARWIAFFDVDEFLFSPSGKPVPEILPEYEQWPAVGVNSAVFLTSGHKARPPGLVIESYLMRRPLNHRAIKSIVDPKRALRCSGGHYFLYESGHAVDVAKQPVEGPRTERYTPQSEQILRINHYYTKSEEELREKWAFPRPDTLQMRDPAELERLLQLPENDRDEKILMYLPALKEALRQRAEHGGKIPL
jgi:Glycosyltransferase family 92